MNDETVVKRALSSFLHFCISPLLDLHTHNNIIRKSHWHLYVYLNRRYPSKTHRSGDLFMKTANQIYVAKNIK